MTDVSCAVRIEEGISLSYGESHFLEQRQQTVTGCTRIVEERVRVAPDRNCGSGKDTCKIFRDGGIMKTVLCGSLDEHRAE